MDLRKVLMIIAVSTTVLFATTNCGKDDHGHIINIKRNKKEVNGDTPAQIKFTAERIREDCFSAGCHGGNSAPSIVDIQAGQKLDAKVEKRIRNKSMPPGGGYKDEEITAFFEFVGS